MTFKVIVKVKCKVVMNIKSFEGQGRNGQGHGQGHIKRKIFPPLRIRRKK